MNKTLGLSAIAAAAMAGGVVLSAVSSAVLADRTFSNRDLRGAYRFNSVRIRNDETFPDLDYCDEFGTIVLDGRGCATGVTTRKCSATPLSDPGAVISESAEFTYDVQPDGEVLISDVISGACGEAGVVVSDPEHGKLVNGGRMVLFDGTTRVPGTASEGGILVEHGTAVRFRRRAGGDRD